MLRLTGTPTEGVVERRLVGGGRPVDAYVRLIDERICRLGGTAQALAAFLDATDGAFPAIVAERLRLNALRWTVNPSECALDDDTRPELHPLDFEWLFDEDSARLLADMGTGRTAAFIGLPSVAGLADHGYLLIERNPLVTARSPSLLNHGEVLTADIQSVDLAGIQPRQFVAFDPPWYPGETLLWLERAAELVEPRGHIGFVLFPELIRAAARMEREEILSFASMLGSVEIVKNAMRYLTPRFEQEALRAAGVPPLRRWRKADLVIIHVHPRSAVPKQLPLAAQPLARERWLTYRINGQVVKLRDMRTRDTRLREHPPLSTVQTSLGWVLPSVSLRHHGREEVDLWTSRNRVARVGDFQSADRTLTDLSASSGPARDLRSWKWSGRRDLALMWSEVLDL